MVQSHQKSSDRRAQITPTSDPSQCLLPKDAGPCQNFHPRYYYNSQTGQCEYFMYGGCLGNFNNFQTLEGCRATCDNTITTVVTQTPTSDPSQCLLPKDAGPCQNFHPRFYYNSQTGQCEYFMYGGCLGNSNNFQTLEDCQAACNAITGPTVTQTPTSDPSQCLLPKDAGPCQNFHPRFYYNSQTGQCEYFMYGGCLGNGNNFQTLEDCQAACDNTITTVVTQTPTSDPSQCLLPKDAGPCQNFHPRYYYNSQTGQCEYFLYGGCLGNWNNFQTLEDCQAACNAITGPTVTQTPTSDPSQCLLPKDAGPCQNFHPRFYYNSQTGQCEYFMYGGCLGNWNNFQTLEDCRAACDNTITTVVTQTPTSDPSQCLLPKDAGPCQNFHPRYYYNSQTGQCEYFLYGGCLGNGNNFQTLEDCRAACDNTITTVVTQTPTSDPSQCLLPKDAGPCQNFHPRYYYNSQTGQCEYFMYGGCLGNSNNFQTLEDCQAACNAITGPTVTQTPTSDPSQCLLPKDAGPCQNFHPRFYYNSQTGQCEYFMYGGCLGNWNNFQTLEDCQAACDNTITTVVTQTPTSDPSQCLLPKDAGPCQNFHPRYYYNSQTGQCEYFLYGGCLGNSNNFQTLEDCQAACNAITGPTVTQTPTSDPSQCLLPKDAGPCQNFHPRFYYNSQTGQCEFFMYGGCLGNWNNFQTLEDCRKACDTTGTTTTQPQPSSHCLQYFDPGHCDAYIHRFYYNAESKSCDSFIYTGCGGNNNNYNTLAECRQACQAIYW
ncbi:hypothetical protein Pmani_005179 [Petrolisthes manimaculis]|uniref:BPTI/Kunitz inhibitor domain-containing protein n=1 Tax=Petrolisthes manimaculis TaxID=1843537 RepID=A0AAE1QD79_9EUCA|nr:hypothetical protein Pmani_005179 [Petrolisthes manimaculis]